MCRKLRAPGGDEDPRSQHSTDRTGRRWEVQFPQHYQLNLQGRDILPRMHRERRKQPH